MSLAASHISSPGVVDNGSVGAVHHLQVVPGESGSSHPGDDIAEKGGNKRSKSEGGGAGGGKGNRGGGVAFSRKRSRAGDSHPLPDAMPDGSLSGGAVASTGRAVSANGTARQPVNSPTPDNGDKSTSRRQNGHSAKRGDKKQTQMATSVNDAPPPKLVEANGVPNNWSSGILDIYGLRTRAMDVSRFMVDISLNDLLKGNFQVPTFYLKDNHDAKVELEEGVEQQIESILRFLPKRPVKKETHTLKTSEVSGSSNAINSKSTKMTLDLEHPGQPDEADVPKVGKTETETHSDVTLEAGANTGASTDVVANGSPSTAMAPPKVFVDSLPVHSVEVFLSKLKLIPSDPLQALVAQTGDGEMSAAVDTRVGSDMVDICRRNGSVPPLLFSYAYVGPMKAENGRYNPRVWVRSPAENSGWKGGSGLSGKEGSDGVGEDGSNSPCSKVGKIDSQYKVQSPDAIQRSTSGASSVSPGQVDPSRKASLGEPIGCVKEEPRQVENAVGFSSEDVKPMDIASSRIDSGSVIGSGADATESAQTIPEDQQRSGGEAVRPLETPPTLARPQELDASSSDWQGKPAAATSPEVKREKLEQKIVVKDPAEEESREATLAPVGLSGMPVVELRINVRGPSPAQIDSSSGLPACPYSPGAEAAARFLCSMANSTLTDPEKIEGDKERRRRVFQPYPGAPAQKTAKSIRVSNSGAPSGEGGREGRRSLDGGPMPSSSKALVSERRKSLSQVNDASEKPAYSSCPRNSSGGGISTGSRGGIHTGARSTTLSIKLEKSAAKESTKEATSSKEVGKGSSSLPPLSHGGPPLKNGHKGVKGSSSFLHSSKGSVASAIASKVPAAPTAQRVVGNGGTAARSSRTVHTSNSPALHSLGPAPFKSSRQSIPEGRQKMKSEIPGRGGKPS